MDEEIKIEGNLDISQALKEFELKQSAKQTQQTVKTSQISEVPKMVQLVMKWSGVQEQKQAEYILLGFVILAIIVSGFLIFSNTTTPPIKSITTQNVLSR